MNLNTKYRDWLFGLICFSLAFNNIPKAISMNFIGGPVGSKLVFYPLFIGMVYTFYCQYKYRNIFYGWKNFLKYSGVYLAVTFLSLILGLINYPYWDVVLSGPVNQIEKLPAVLNFLQAHGIHVDTKVLMSAWIVVRQIKSTFLELFWYFGGSYMVYLWYREDWKRGLKLALSGISLSLVLIFAYSFIELAYLSGNKTAKDILINITPFFHSIKNDGKWWPPLLWPGQVRSIFAEPSYLGIWTAACLPFFWRKLYTKTKKYWLYLALIVFWTFLLFTARARTAFMLHLGELMLLVIFVAWMRNREMIKKTAVIVACSAVAFFFSNVFITTGIYHNTLASMFAPQPKQEQTAKKPVVNNNLPKAANPKQNVQQKQQNQPKPAKPQQQVKPQKPLKTSTATSYLEDNALSLLSSNKRSNRPRYSVMEADFKIGLHRPLLGVGNGLRNAYIPDFMPKAALQIAEVRMWLRFRKKLGIIKSGFPRLGEYTARFAETGIIGLLIFLFPSFMVIKKFVVNLLHKAVSAENITFLVAFIGSMAAAIGDTINIIYAFWVLLGLGFAMLFPAKETLKKE